MAVKQTTPRRNTVPPAKTVQLMTTLGPTKASQQLGVSTTMLHKARQEGEISRVVEIAAAAVLEKLPSETIKKSEPARTEPPRRVERGGDAVFLIAMPRDKAPLIERLARELGAEIVVA